VFIYSGRREVQYREHIVIQPILQTVQQRWARRVFMNLILAVFAAGRGGA